MHAYIRGSRYKKAYNNFKIRVNSEKQRANQWFNFERKLNCTIMVNAMVIHETSFFVYFFTNFLSKNNSKNYVLGKYMYGKQLRSAFRVMR